MAAPDPAPYAETRYLACLLEPCLNLLAPPVVRRRRAQMRNHGSFGRSLCKEVRTPSQAFCMCRHKKKSQTAGCEGAKTTPAIYCLSSSPVPKQATMEEGYLPGVDPPRTFSFLTLIPPGDLVFSYIPKPQPIYSPDSVSGHSTCLLQHPRQTPNDHSEQHRHTNMMTSALGLPFTGTAYPYQPLPCTAESLLDDLSRQMSTSPAARRLSRGSVLPRPGTAMRIVKPSSASNSPRSSMNLYKRRTFLHDDGHSRRGQQAVDHVLTLPPPPPPPPLPPPTNPDFSTEAPVPRPVSWHPASSSSSSYYNRPHTQFQPNITTTTAPYQMPTPGALYHHQMSPMMASYSCHTSPTNFSPLALPLNDFSATQPGLHNSSWNLQTHSTPSYASPDLESRLGCTEAFPALSSTASRSSATTDWNSLVSYGFDRYGGVTSPPTPETLPQAQEPKTAVVEESISYHGLEQPAEQEGEILVGMGLYDAPDKYDHDMSLNNYRSTMSSLLGGNRSPGKGLKLEETWEPPESDDDEDDDEGDDEGDDEEDDDETRDEGS
jgi:hypothetical protein